MLDFTVNIHLMHHLCEQVVTHCELDVASHAHFRIDSDCSLETFHGINVMLTGVQEGQCKLIPGREVLHEHLPFYRVLLLLVLLLDIIFFLILLGQCSSMLVVRSALHIIISRVLLSHHCVSEHLRILKDKIMCSLDALLVFMIVSLCIYIGLYYGSIRRSTLWSVSILQNLHFSSCSLNHTYPWVVMRKYRSATSTRCSIQLRPVLHGDAIV